jgi:hypothetical protein
VAVPPSVLLGAVVLGALGGEAKGLDVGTGDGIRVAASLGSELGCDTVFSGGDKVAVAAALATAGVVGGEVLWEQALNSKAAVRNTTAATGSH